MFVYEISEVDVQPIVRLSWHSPSPEVSLGPSGQFDTIKSIVNFWYRREIDKTSMQQAPPPDQSIACTERRESETYEGATLLACSDEPRTISRADSRWFSQHTHAQSEFQHFKVDSSCSGWLQGYLPFWNSTTTPIELPTIIPSTRASSLES